MKAPAEAEFSLAGRVALVTGGATGIGHVIVQMLAAADARVVLVGLPEQDPAARAHALREEGLDVHGMACDVTSERQLRALIERVQAEHDRLDVVVANAGVALDAGPHLTTTDEQLDAMFALHVRSVLHLANLALPLVARSGGGALMVMSSIAGLRGNRVLGAYGITKAANAQLARNLAVQWGGRGIRVNAISPGVIRTGFATPIIGDDAIAQRRLDRTPLGRFGRPEEVASAVLWLAGPGGAFVTGQNIVIDGGTLIAD